MVSPLDIFCCYAREDQALMESLCKHLKPLQRRGLIKIWSDIDINAGDLWEDEIKRHLDSANIILLLVSPDYMDSDYCYSTEMERAMQRHTKKEARVIPIILRPTNWEGAPFETLQALPTDAKPVTDRRSWLSEDEALNDVSKRIGTIVSYLLKDQWLAEGDIHYKAGRYLEALASAEQACKLDPTYARAYNRKGSALYRLKRYQEALAAHMKAIEYNANYGEAYSGKGHALRALNHSEEALKAYEMAIQLGSAYSYIWYEKGNTLCRLERHEEALEAYEVAIQRDPSYVNAYIGKGNALRRLEKYEEALIAFQQASELQPNNAGYLDSIGTVLRDLKRYEEALAFFNKAIELDSNSIDIYLHKGRVFLDLERYEEALNVYKRAIEVAPNNTWAWHDEGVALHHLEQDEEALQAFNRALDINPNNMWAWHHKALALERLAQQAHEKAKELGFLQVEDDKLITPLNSPLSMIGTYKANAPLNVIVIGDDDAAIRLHILLASASSVQQVMFRANETKAWEDLRRGKFNTIFIDPFAFGLDDATRFIFRVRQEYPLIVFVLYLDLKTLNGNKKDFSQGERSRFSHYFTLDKGLSSDDLSLTLDSMLDKCKQYLQNRAS